MTTLSHSFRLSHFRAIELRRFNIFCVIGSLGILAGLIVLNALNPDALAHLLVKDVDHVLVYGVENLTFVILLPGIAAACVGVKRFSSAIPPYLRIWMILWALACIYFAGEEISWGQWYAGWESPETFSRINDQEETNFHNMSSWLDQKPRAMVEAFIILAGGILPFVTVPQAWLRKKPVKDAAIKLSRITPSPALAAPALLFLVSRYFDWFPAEAFHNLGNSELREFTIAWFLTLYLTYLALYAREMKEVRNDPDPFASESINL